MENFLHYCEYFGIVNLRLTKLAVRIPLSSSRPVRLGRGEGQGEEANAAASKSRLMESLLLLSEPIATMNRCYYARGLTAVPPPLPEGEGRGEGEFWRVRPYGSWVGGPYVRTMPRILSAFTALFLASAAPATAATNCPDL